MARSYVVMDAISESPSTVELRLQQYFDRLGKVLWDSRQRQSFATLAVGLIKVANCQVAPSLCVATSRPHPPADMQLYLPQCWAEDSTRRKKTQIPDEVTFQTKPQSMLGLIDRALAACIPPGFLSDLTPEELADVRRRLVAQMAPPIAHFI